MNQKLTAKKYIKETIREGFQKLLNIDPNDETHIEFQSNCKTTIETAWFCYNIYKMKKGCSLERGNLPLPKTTRKPHFTPDPNAVGAHTVFRRNGVTGKITHYETYFPQTNHFDPKPWKSVLRYDGTGDPNAYHFNKFLKTDIFEPHIHDPSFSGGVRPADVWEIPK